MKLSTNFLAVLAVLVAQTSNAEILLAPSFPGPDQWVSASTIPIESNDGNATAEVKTFYLAPEDKNNPQNTVSIISAMGTSKSVGAVEYLSLMAQGLQQKCESLRATRPTLFLEKRTPVSYARLYCSKIKGADVGIVQTIKVLQGASSMFAVVREWQVAPFDFQVAPSATEQFANKLFRSPDDASKWLQQMASANDHLAHKVFLCAEKEGQFGEPCASK